MGKTILEGMVDGKGSRGRPEKSWMTKIIDWKGMKTVVFLKAARDRAAWKRVEERSAVVLQRPDG